MAVHYSEYSAVLEVEKAMLALELGRLGQLLLKTNQDRRKLQEKLQISEKSSKQQIFQLQTIISEKVAFLNILRKYFREYLKIIVLITDHNHRNRSKRIFTFQTKCTASKRRL